MRGSQRLPRGTLLTSRGRQQALLWVCDWDFDALELLPAGPRKATREGSFD